MKFEADEVTLLTGVRHGETLGSPIAIMVGNTEWPKWETVMAPDEVDAEVLAAQARNAPLTRPRPGHADLAGMQKYDWDEARPILERASARETAARVALGRVASNFLDQAYGVRLVSHVVEIGSVASTGDRLPTFADRDAIDADAVRCFDADSSARMLAEIDAAKADGDTLGGVVEVVVTGLPPGAWAPTSRETAASTPAWPAPSWASRPSRAWRSGTGSSSPAPAVPSPTTRWCWTPTTSPAPATAPAAPRAA